MDGFTIILILVVIALLWKPSLLTLLLIGILIALLFGRR